jgi:putative endopeptidase
VVFGPRRRAAGLALAAWAAACVPGPREPVRRSTPDPAALERAVLGALDPSADPCQDFYQYACGGWLARVPPPADRPQVMRSLTSIEARNRALLVAVLEREGTEAGHRAASAYFDSCMDVAAVEATGLRPLEPWLREIEDVEDLEGLFAGAARLRRVPGASPLVFLALERDAHDPTRRVMRLAPGGFALPDPRLYLDPERRDLVDDYRSHVARMLELAGARAVRSRAEARAVVELERELARAATEATGQGGARLDRAALQRLDPGLPWAVWFEALGPGAPDSLDVASPAFVRALGATLAAVEPDVLRAYLRWQLLHATASRLGRAFDEEDFAFQSKLTGQSVMAPHPERCAEATLAAMPDEASRAFVEAAFPGESRALAAAMLDGVAAAFTTSLPGVSWMDAQTKAVAAAKAARVARRVGYPDPWPPGPAFEVHPDRYLENSLAAGAARLARELAAASAPVDPAEWPVPAIAMRGFYDARANAITFPAGLLQPPLFERGYPPALRWGGSGPMLGHEWTHGFDAQGALFDAEGRLAGWWSEATRDGFEAPAACLVEQYGGFEVEPGVALDGLRTLAENAADVGGLALAHRAFRAEIGDRAGGRSPIGELSHEQLFFVAYGQAWCARSQPGFDAAMARSDPRARPRFRVNGPLANLPAFAEAFACDPGAPMTPSDRCEVW